MGTLTGAVPPELRAMRRWVCADEGSKQPVRCSDGTPASVSRPGDWGSFEEAAECVERGWFDYLGFVFAGDGVVGIDVDRAFGEDGMLSADAVETIWACGSYAEVSKSGNGIHILCLGELPFRGRNNRAGWEIYREARYFVLTGRTVMFRELAEAQEGIDLVMERHFADAPREGGGRRGPRTWEPEWLPRDDGRIALAPSYPPVASGSRHLSLVSYCGQQWNAGCPRDRMLGVALRQNERGLVPPLPEAEVAQIVASVTRYGR